MKLLDLKEMMKNKYFSLKINDNSYSKPLILRGIRQCGKTWLLKEYGKKYYNVVAYRCIILMSFLKTSSRIFPSLTDKSQFCTFLQHSMHFFKSQF